jgi:hypothetical protein
MAANELHEGAISPRTAWSRVVIKENLRVLLVLGATHLRVMCRVWRVAFTPYYLGSYS